MAMTPEKKVKNKVVRLLKEYGAYYFFPASYGMGRSGVPDIVCCLRGCFIGIECKAGKNKPTPLQEKELADIIKAGGVSCVINEDNMAELESILTTVMSKDTNDGLTGGRL
jgi:Holliday junction resolvase